MQNIGAELNQNRRIEEMQADTPAALRAAYDAADREVEILEVQLKSAKQRRKDYQLRIRVERQKLTIPRKRED